MMLSHIEAKKLVERTVPGISPGASLLVRAIGWLETNYGAGWKGEAAQASHNWGAITGGYQGKSFEYKDSRYDPKTEKVVEYTTNFRSYPDDASAAKDLYQFLLGSCPKAVAAAEDGD